MPLRVLSLLSAGLHSGFAGRASLRAVKEQQRHPAFTSVETCETEYKALREECDANEGGSKDYANGLALGRQGGLIDDEDGGSNILSNGASDAHGRRMYKPPSSGGVPSDITGWDYRSHGDDWDHLGECADRGFQSPVDLARYVDVQGQTKYMLWFDYFLDPYLKPTKQAKLINDGHGVRYDIKTNGVDMGYLKIGDQEFVATEYIFHAPSEHSMDGAIFPLELQLYNRGKTGGIVAVAILFREGRSNSFLAGLKKSLDGKAPTWSVKDGSGTAILTGANPAAFDLEAVIPRGDVSKEQTFYNYQGSLTQPPCTSGVDWWVLSMPMTATRDEIRFIRRGIYSSSSTRHGNARSTMPLGNRSIFVGLTGFQHASKTHVMPQYEDLNRVKQPRGYDSQDMPWGFHWAPDLAAPGPAPGPAPGQATSPAPAL